MSTDKLTKKELAFEAKLKKIVEAKKEAMKEKKELDKLRKAKEQEELLKNAKTLMDLIKNDFAGITSLTELKTILKPEEKPEVKPEAKAEPEKQTGNVVLDINSIMED